MFACVAISPSFKLLCFTILKETGLLVYSSTCLLVYSSTYINKITSVPFKRDDIYLIYL